MNLLEQFKQARRSGVPLIGIETSDPTCLMDTILNAMNGSKSDKPIIQWDMVRTAVGRTDLGGVWIDAICNGNDPMQVLGDPAMFLNYLQKFPDSGMVFMLSTNRLIEQASVVQGIWNLRDTFKGNGATLVMLGPIGWKMPGDIKDDIIVLSEPLPNKEQLTELVGSLSEDSKIQIDKDATEKAVDAVSGLSLFGAEQVIAMSLKKDGLSSEELWDRKRKAIEQTPGLSVWRGGETFADIGGYDNVKTFMKRLLHGNMPPKVILFIDEIEKAFAGTQGDTSGVSQDFHGAFLSWAQDNKMSGCIFIGPSGSGKTMVAHATGAEVGIPTIGFDVNAMKGMYQGQSGGQFRSALEIVRSVGQGNVMALATCNSFGSISPELKRRFKTGTFFFDLPTKKERLLIWELCIKKFFISDTKVPADDNWTGAEISQCCEVAYRLNCSLEEAAQYVVPVAESGAAALESLRKQASGCFTDASKPGRYKYEQSVLATPRRRVS